MTPDRCANQHFCGGEGVLLLFLPKINLNLIESDVFTRNTVNQGAGYMTQW